MQSSTFLRAAILLIFLVVSGPGPSNVRAQQSVPSGISLLTTLRVRDSAGWWPTKSIDTKDQFVGTAACVRCHAAKAASFDRAAMAHAAARSDDSELARRHDALELQVGPYHYQLASVDGKGTLKVSDSKASVSVQLAWAFGVGRMGQTYIYVQNGSYYEGHVSFYASPQALDITPGQTRAIPTSLEQAAGRRMSPDEAQYCFGCHTTGSMIKGQFDPSAASLGVTCEQCHGPGASHVAAENAGTAQPGESSIFNPARLDHVESVDFCGACHRTWEDVLTLNADAGIFNVRFAPYRLENSKCWKKSGQRLTCTMCHDPHQPLTRDDSSYDPVCLQCHSSTASQTAPTSPATTKERKVRRPAICRVATKNCVSCHMPKVEPLGLHSSFTDHWIRIAREHEPYPE